MANVKASPTKSLKSRDHLMELDFSGRGKEKNGTVEDLATAGDDTQGMADTRLTNGSTGADPKDATVPETNPTDGDTKASPAVTGTSLKSDNNKEARLSTVSGTSTSPITDHHEPNTDGVSDTDMEKGATETNQTLLPAASNGRDVERHLPGEYSNGKSGHKEVSPRSSLLKLLKRREFIVCGIGLVTFLIGLILIIVGVATTNKCSAQYNGSEDEVVPHSSHEDSSLHGLEHLGVPHSHSTALHGHGAEERNVTYVHNHLTNTTEKLINLAVHRPAFQSSTSQSREGVTYNASLTVDGNHGDKMARNTCSQTNFEDRPYWTVDLGESHLVSTVKLVVPSDCCVGELHNFEVRIGPHPDAASNPLCRDHLGVALKVALHIQCDMQMAGRYVSIQILGDEIRKRNRLTLCEVLVYG